MQAATGCGTGAFLWDGSVLLAQHLAARQGTAAAAGSAIELGAGCSGVPSIGPAGKCTTSGWGAHAWPLTAGLGSG